MAISGRPTTPHTASIILPASEILAIVSALAPVIAIPKGGVETLKVPAGRTGVDLIRGFFLLDQEFRRGQGDKFSAMIGITQRQHVLRRVAIRGSRQVDVLFRGGQLGLPMLAPQRRGPLAKAH